MNFRGAVGRVRNRPTQSMNALDKCSYHSQFMELRGDVETLDSKIFDSLMKILGETFARVFS